MVKSHHNFARHHNTHDRTCCRVLTIHTLHGITSPAWRLVTDCSDPTPPLKQIQVQVEKKEMGIKYARFVCCPKKQWSKYLAEQAHVQKVQRRRGVS